MNDLTKHKILSELAKCYNERTYDVHNYTETGKSLSGEEIHRKTGLHLDNLNMVLKSLSHNDYIKPVNLIDKENQFYLITDKGFDALSDKRFVWYAPSLDKVLRVAPILISITALCVSIYVYRHSKC